MLNLDQVRLLENRVEKAVGKIQSLGDENARLKKQLSALQARASELEGLVQSFKDDQGRIEEGILNALDRLSAFEDSMFQADAVPVASKRENERDTPVRSVEADEAPLVDSGIDIMPEFQESPQERATAAPSDGQMDIF